MEECCVKGPAVKPCDPGCHEHAQKANRPDDLLVLYAVARGTLELLMFVINDVGEGRSG